MSLYIPIELRRRIMEVDRSCCAYCHSAESLMGVTFEIEHILPISAGGVTEFDNLCLSCPTCNRHKSNRLVAMIPKAELKCRCIILASSNGLNILPGTMTQ